MTNAIAPHPYAALRLPSYRLLLAGGVLAALGSQVQSVTVAWELYERTNSPVSLAMSGLMLFLPVLLFSLPAGHMADRFSRKIQLVAAQGVMTFTSLALLLCSLLEAPVDIIYIVLFLSGTSRAFSAPARNSLLPAVVPPELIGSAVTWNTTGFQVAFMAGPALGGFCIAINNRAEPAYLFAAVCSAGSLLALALMQGNFKRRRAESLSLKTLLAGVQFVWRNDLILAAITLDLFAVLLGGATALMPIYAKDILHVGPEWLGWLRGAPAVGAVVMAIFLTHRPPLRYAGPSLLLAVAGFGAATIVFGISKNLWLSLGTLAVTGALDNVSVVIRQTMVQLLTPDDMKGRVTAVNMIFISSSNELGEFESGITAHWFGTVPSVVLGGIGTILVVILAIARWPQLLDLRTLRAPERVDNPDESIKAG